MTVIENRMTVRKGYPGRGSTATSHFGTKCPRSPGSVPTPEHAAIVGVPEKSHGLWERRSSGASEFALAVNDDTQLATTRQEAVSGRTDVRKK